MLKTKVFRLLLSGIPYLNEGIPMAESSKMAKPVRISAKELRGFGVEYLADAVEGLADHCVCFIDPKHLENEAEKKSDEQLQ